MFVVVNMLHALLVHFLVVPVILRTLQTERKWEAHMVSRVILKQSEGGVNSYRASLLQP